MPRIRSIKPEFWQDEKLAPMRPIDRLVFVGLISMADDAGRLIDNLKAIDGFLFSETADSASESLGLLARTGRILRYTSSSGQRLIQLMGWAKHQRVEKPGLFILPAPSETDLAGLAPCPRNGVPVNIPGTVGDSAAPDLGSRSKELGTRNPPSSPRAREEAFVEQFPETHQDDIRTLLRRVSVHDATRAESWIRGLEARLTGMHPPVVPAAILAEAVRQFNMNGGSNWRSFEAYVRKVAAGPPPETANGHRTPTDIGARAGANALAAATALTRAKAGT